jgi:hypothetical protein
VLLLLLWLLLLQDPVWAEQAVVFPDWDSYSQQLSDRAREAGRYWLDSIKPDRRTSTVTPLQAETAVALPLAAAAAGAVDVLDSDWSVREHLTPFVALQDKRGGPGAAEQGRATGRKWLKEAVGASVPSA